MTSSENQNSFQEICSKFKDLYQDVRAVDLSHDWIDAYRDEYDTRSAQDKVNGGVEIETECLPQIYPNLIQTEALA